MYISVRKYRTAPDNAAEVLRKVREEFAPILAGSEGFIKYYCFGNGEGVVSSVSIFESESQAEESNRVAAHWVRQNLRELLPSPPEVISGELSVDR